jgi:hypothetical protein
MKTIHSTSSKYSQLRMITDHVAVCMTHQQLIISLQQNSCFIANRNIVTELNTSSLGVEFVQTGQMSCHSVPWYQGLSAV